MKTLKQYCLERSPLYGLRNLRQLAEFLKVSVTELRHVERLIKYHTYPQSKPNGDYRTISAPSRKLKTIQRRILLYLRRIDTPEWLVSGKKGKCYIDNARIHMDSCFVVTADISKFFDHCLGDRVYQLFRNTFNMAEDIATVLTKLTTLNHLVPTGTPTSQILAFWCYRNMFEEIAAVAENKRLKFSLYVDDITFSSSKQIGNSVVYQTSCILKKYSHSLKKEKVRHYGKNEFKHITGVAISPNGLLIVPNSLRWKIKHEMFCTGDLCFRSKTMKGRIVAAKSISPNCYPQLFQALSR